ncbi:hypothetical protein L248_2819 [Schleiferilactobacillus shenzhenensis LY-73]|uniref:Uncharacterized protein n=1 Tax=Schleiferilactobacillus shenzhenensis LY-73 TaxID=1231336 RepID=U4TPQ1_9LACO|nr:hypothetical protein L248_2819 [Schleiferilactobacillus shenzhenensis LY-73]
MIFLHQLATTNCNQVIADGIHELYPKTSKNVFLPVHKHLEPTLVF